MRYVRTNLTGISRTLILPLILLMFCGDFGFVGQVQADDAPAQTDPVEAANSVGPRALSKAFRNAASKSTPSVVTIFAYGQPGRTLRRSERSAQPQLPGGNTPEPDQPAEATEKDMTGVGSGVIVSEDGLVITNNHVITQAKRVVVQLSDETEITASVFRGDSDSDVGMLRIQRDSPFVAAGIGDSDSLEVGDWVLAIGSPFRLEATVSAGIISAKNRPLDRIRRGRMLQTDAAINPGNSGGPLIDLDGNVIGISTAIATRDGGYQGIGFAIPVNQAKWIADELDQHAEVRRAAIGATMLELKPKYAKLFKKPAFSGVLVYQVIEDSAADRAGIKQLDVILEFAGERVRSPEGLQEVVERKPVGSFQDVKIKRGEETVILKVELASVEDPTQTGKNVAASVEKKQASEPDADAKLGTKDVKEDQETDEDRETNEAVEDSYPDEAGPSDSVP